MEDFRGKMTLSETEDTGRLEETDELKRIPLTEREKILGQMGFDYFYLRKGEQDYSEKEEKDYQE